MSDLSSPLSFFSTVSLILTAPREAFRTLPQSHHHPGFFLTKLALLAGILTLLVSAFSTPGRAFGIASGRSFLFFVFIPGLVVVFLLSCSIMAALLNLIWKFLGSQEPYATAFRCTAYAMTPIFIAFPLDSMIGVGVLSNVWPMYLLVIASTEVHGIKARTAWLVFGTFCFLSIASGMLSVWQRYQYAPSVSPPEATLRTHQIPSFQTGFRVP